MNKIELMPNEELLFQDTVHYSKMEAYVKDLESRPYAVSVSYPLAITTKRLVLGEDNRVIPLRQIEDVEVNDWVLPKPSFTGIKYMPMGKKVVIHTANYEIMMHFAASDAALCKKLVTTLQNAIACL